MYKFSYKLIIIQILIVYTIIIQKTSSRPIEDKNQPLSLYDDTDSGNVVILDVNNFTKTIYGTKNAWVVEFYVHWCGYCQRFAPIWKSLSHDIAGWKDIINIAVINCAIEANSALCRQYKARPWPMVKYFSAYSKEDEIGERLDKEYDEDFLRHLIITRLQNDQVNGKGQDTWPNLLPYRDFDFMYSWNDIPMSVDYQFYLFETNNKSDLGSEIILDLHKLTNIRIYRVTPENSLWTEYNVTDKPKLFVLDRENTVTELDINQPTRIQLIKIIEDFTKFTEPSTTDTEEMSMFTTEETAESIEFTSMKSVESQDDSLHYSDLENALEYSLKQEISTVSIFNDEKMKALENYLQVLALYFPAKNPNSTYIKSIQDFLQNREVMTGEEFKNIIEMAEIKDPEFITENSSWVNCKGSKLRYRGYPCGLWTLFHTLTVNYANTNDESAINTPGKILTTMYDYVKNFFGCSDCAQHFVEMANERKIEKITTRDQAVLWLWAAHNQVNQRLAGDMTEDPAFPKIQYPSRENCPMCRADNDKWNEEEVLKYLKKKYERSEIKYE